MAALKQIRLKQIRWMASIGVFLAVWILAINPAHASVVTVPDGLSPGDTYRLVFVTSITITAESSTISDYNDLVNEAAYATGSSLAGLTTAWTAIVSTSSIDAITNTYTDPSYSIDTPIYNLDGELVASNLEELWSGKIQNYINVNEYGDEVSVDVWTGTEVWGGANITGAYMGRTGSYIVSVGSTTELDSDWVKADSDYSYHYNALYAISMPITVAAVPVPPAIWLMGSGLVALAGFRRKGRKA